MGKIHKGRSCKLGGPRSPAATVVAVEGGMVTYTGGGDVRPTRLPAAMFEERARRAEARAAEEKSAAAEAKRIKPPRPAKAKSR